MFNRVVAFLMRARRLVQDVVRFKQVISRQFYMNNKQTDDET